MSDQKGEFSKLWRRRRLLLRWGIAIYFILIAFVLGPMYLLHGVDMGPRTPADFTAEVQLNCVPVVRKMKEYERVHGHRPDDIRTFAPEFTQTQGGQVNLRDGGYMYYAEYHHLITYDFTRGNEHWSVKGPFVNGDIPLPPVLLEPMVPSTTNP